MRDVLIPADLSPGQLVEILSHHDFGRPVWRFWRILPYEVPRKDREGNWLFTAETADGQLGPSPMKVSPDRIRLVEPVEPVH